MKKAFITLFILMAAGCAGNVSNSSTPVHEVQPAVKQDIAHRIYHGQSDKFTTSEQHDIERAMDVIRNQTSGAVQFEIVWDGNMTADNTISIVDKPSPISPTMMASNYHSDATSSIVMYKEVMKVMVEWYDEDWNNVVSSVAMHELVHSLKVEHLEKGLMSASAHSPMPQCIDELAMTEVEKNIDVVNPKPCKL
jgi:hypothetical protein